MATQFVHTKLVADSRWSSPQIWQNVVSYVFIINHNCKIAFDNTSKNLSRVTWSDLLYFNIYLDWRLGFLLSAPFDGEHQNGVGSATGLRHFAARQPQASQMDQKYLQFYMECPPKKWDPMGDRWIINHLQSGMHIQEAVGNWKTFWFWRGNPRTSIIPIFGRAFTPQTKTLW